jgi:hypothetical protein
MATAGEAKASAAVDVAISILDIMVFLLLRCSPHWACSEEGTVADLQKFQKNFID